MRYEDLTGQRFERLVVVGKADKKANDGRILWLCKCDCGNPVLKEVRGNDLKLGKVLSCRCYWKEIKPTIQTSKYGKAVSRSLTYKTWVEMRRRCRANKEEHKKYYKDRGITVCNRWLDYLNFLVDMGERPSKKHSIDRINVNGNYEPGNCRWATTKEQSINKQNTVRVTYKNETLPLKTLIEKHNKDYDLVYGRLKNGWDIEKALNTPKKILPSPK